MRASQAGPAIGLIAQVLLLAVLAGTAGLGAAGSVVAHDPKVMDQIAGWGWQDGMLPSPQAPVWPMAAFRDRFLTAFGSGP